MRKIVLLAMGLILVLAIQSCGGSSSGSGGGGGDGDGSGNHKWTYMVYMAADNSLSDFADYDLAEMRSVGSNSDVAIVTQFESYTYWTQRLYFHENADNNESVNPCGSGDCDLDMADPDTLSDFIEWAMETYEAENYVLVLWDHGSGWRNEGDTLRLLSRGAIQDETSGTYMSVADITAAISAAETATGQTISIVRFDACLMQMYEVAFAFSGLTNYLVGSEELVPGEGDPYDTILDGLKADPDMTPAELSEFIVNTFDTSYDGTSDTTNSALDMSQIDALDTAVTALAAQLSADTTVAQNAVSITQDFSGSGSNYDYHDLYDLADYIATNAANVDVVAAAEAVKTAFDSLVINSKTNGTTVADSYGLSIYLPANAETDDATIAEYQGLSCNDRDDVATTWGDFISVLW